MGVASRSIPEHDSFISNESTFSLHICSLPYTRVQLYGLPYTYCSLHAGSVASLGFSQLRIFLVASRSIPEHGSLIFNHSTFSLHIYSLPYTRVQLYGLPYTYCSLHSAIGHMYPRLFGK